MCRGWPAGKYIHIFVLTGALAFEACEEAMFFCRALLLLLLRMVLATRQVEKVMGPKKFLATYVLSGVAGNALSCIVNPNMPVRP